MRATIIISSHNEGDLLRKTVESCIESTAGLDYEIIVADDASTDGSPEKIERQFPPVKLHRHPSRQGASPTKHLGATHARGETLLFIDGHSKPEYGSLNQLVRSVEETNGQAVVTPRILALDVQRWQNVPTQVGHGYAFDLLTLDCRWVSLDDMQKANLGRGQFYESPALIGCAFAVSRTVYENVWGLDANMKFWGVEDLDFALKCWLMGHPILHQPTVAIGHRFQETFDRYSVPLEHIVVNQLRLAYKNYTYGVWSEWVRSARERHNLAQPENPEGLWAQAWELFKAGEENAYQERRHLQAQRIHDEFWYAKRFSLSWPRLVSQPEMLARPFGTGASPSPSPRPSPSPPPCSITSRTVATTPPNRARTRVGVGEQVVLTVTPGPANWSVVGQGTVSPPTGTTVTFTAADRGGTATIRAQRGTSRCSVVFTVVEPSGVVMQRHPGSGIRHQQNRPDSGLQTDIYFTPDNVSFQNVLYHELDVPAVATGVYAPFNGVGHSPNPAPLSVNGVVPGLGSKVNGIDNIYSGDPGTPAPFAPGSITFDIPYEFKVGTGAFKRFATVRQQSTLAADGVTLTSSKAGASIAIKVGDPTSTF